SGTIGLADGQTTDLQYDILGADFEALKPLTGQDASGTLTTNGRVSGTSSSLHAAGDATLNQFNGFGVSALTFSGHYDATAPPSDLARATAKVNGQGSFLTLFGQEVRDASGTVTLEGQRLGFDVKLAQTGGLNGGLNGSIMLRTDRREIELEDLT